MTSIGREWSIRADRDLTEDPECKAQGQRKTDYQNQADIRIHDFSPKAKMTLGVIPALTGGAR